MSGMDLAAPTAKQVTGRSMLFNISVLYPKQEVEERMQKCCDSVLALMDGKMSDREVHDMLNQQVCKGPKEHEDTCLALLYLILTEPGQSSKAFRDLTLVNRDGMGCVLIQLMVLIAEHLQKMLETCRGKLLWMVSELMRSNVLGVDSLISTLLRQLPGGDVSPEVIVLVESTLSILKANRAWLDRYPSVMATSVYCFLRLIEDHDAPHLRNLRQQETDYCLCLLREKFSDCLQLGRDLVRALQGVSRIPEFAAMWRDILQNPQSLSTQFSGVQQLLGTRSSRKLLASRLTIDIENKLVFMTSKVSFGQQKRYQEWFQRQYLSTPGSQTMIPDLVRYICCVIHPTNEVLSSDIIPRWAVIGWLMNLCQKDTVLASARLALFYDWMFFSSEKDNIMNIEPGFLLMYKSMKSHPTLTTTLMDFIFRMTSSFLPSMEAVIKTGLKNSFACITEKRVVSNIAPLFSGISYPPELKSMIKDIFPVIPSCVTEEPFIVSPKADMVMSVKGNMSPSHLIEAEGDLSDVVVISPNAESAFFSDEEESPLPNPSSVNVEDPVLVQEDDSVKVDISSELQALDNELLRSNISLLHSAGDLQSRTEAMDGIISMLGSMREFDEDSARVLASCLCKCSVIDMAAPCLPCKVPPRVTADILDKPFYTVFRPLRSTSDADDIQDHIFLLMHKWAAVDPKLGYHLLFYLAVGSDMNFSVYEDFIASDSSKVLQNCFVEDLKNCHRYDPALLLWLAPLLFKHMRKVATGNVDVIHILVSAVGPQELCSLMMELMSGSFEMFLAEELESLIVCSLDWDSFEQYALWQLVIAEEPALDSLMAVLPLLKEEEHPEAVSSMLMILREHSPTQDMVKAVMCMSPTDNVLFSPCLLRYWCHEESRELAHIISGLLTKHSGSIKKNRLKTSASRLQPTLDQILEHLQLLYNRCRGAKDKTFFKYESMVSALETTMVNMDESSSSKYKALFDFVVELQDKASRKRNQARRSAARKGNSSGEFSEEFSASESDKEESDESDSDSPPVKKRRGTIQDEDSD